MITADSVAYSGIFNLPGIRCALMALAAGVSTVGLINRASAEVSQPHAIRPNESTPPVTMDERARFDVGYDPFEEQFSGYDPFDAQRAVFEPLEESPLALPVRNPQLASDRTIPPSHVRSTTQRSLGPLRMARLAQLAAPQEPTRLELQQTEELPFNQSDTEGQPPASSEDPCAPTAERPLSELTIGIGMSEGDMPRDFAAACWEQIESQAGPYAAARCWPIFAYHWNATCFCHRPLYFEEINLERYGYGCCECLQPAASAAHFFATVPALPYCMAAECPGECIYTLRHYRPGSCPPWRRHYPPRDGLAAASEAGVLTGLIFLIP